MKLKHLLLTALCAVMSMSAWAAPADYLSGWTEVTSLPTNNAELSKYYYVIVEGDMMVGQDKATKPDGQENQLTAVYMTPADPKTNNKLVWTLDYNSTWEYGLRSLAHQGHYMQSREGAPWRLQAAWETGQSQWTHMVMAYSEGTWTIQNKGHLKDTNGDYGTAYWGSWGEGNDRYTNGYCLAGNKSGNFIGKFKIYSMLRCLYTPMTPNKDMTDCISNPSFNNGNINDWTVNNDGGKSIGYHASGDFDGKFAEVYQLENNKNTNIEQTIRNLPAGLYKVTCRSVARNVKSAQLYANSNNADMLITDAINDYEVYEKLNEPGSITLGARVTGSGAGGSWFAVDAFTLTYVADDFEEVVITNGLLYRKELETVQTTAKETFDANKTVANYQSLVAAAAATKAEKDYEDGQVALTTAALASGTIATNQMDGWRCTNIQTFHVNTWSTEGNTDGSNMTTPFIENWTAAGGLLGNGEVSYLMVGLTPGATYTFSALGRAIIENKNETLHGITMFANEAEADLSTQGTANYDGKNSLVYGTFTLTGTVNSDGVLAIGFKINDTNCNWLSFKNVKFGELPSDADKTALAEAIAAADGKTYGFQDGEYASYVNAAAIAALETAKAVDVEHAMKAEIVNATNALTNAVWTVNVGEVNAVANGDFEGSYTVLAGSGVSNDRAIYVPEGWTVNYTNRETNDMTCLNSSTLQWNQFKDLPQPANGGNNTYWERFRWSDNASIVLSQVIPNLPAGTYYLSADAYVNGNTATAKISVEGKEVTVNQTSWNNYKVYFSIAEQKNVTVAFSYVQGGEAADSRAGFDNFVLKTTNIVEVQVPAAVGMTTYVTPVALDFSSTELKAYKATSANNQYVHLEEVGAVPANTPLFLIGETENVPVVASASAVEGNLFVAGTGAAVSTEDGFTNYVFAYDPSNIVETKGFYYIENDAATVPVGKAYLHVPASVEPAARLRFVIGDETAIESVNEATRSTQAYNIAGQRVGNDYKGIVIKNGKKVLVK